MRINLQAIFLSFPIIFGINVNARVITSIISGTVKDNAGKALRGAKGKIAYADAGVNTNWIGHRQKL